MPGHFGSGWKRAHGVGFQGAGRLERMGTVGFCEERRCTELAAWRVGHEQQMAELCPRHTLSAMRNRSVWAGT